MRRLANVPLVGLCLGACGDTAGPEHAPILTTIEVAPLQVSMSTTGQEQQLVAVSLDQNGDLLSGVTL